MLKRDCTASSSCRACFFDFSVGFPFSPLGFDGDLTVLQINHRSVSITYSAVQHLDGEAVQYPVLDYSLERPSAIYRIEALISKILHRCGCHFQSDLALCQASPHAVELQVNYAA